MLAVTGGPFKIIQQRPVHVAVDRNAFVQALAHARERLIDESNATRIIVGGDAVFGYEDRLADGPMRPADSVGESSGIEFVACRSELGTHRRSRNSIGVYKKPRVGLDAEKVRVLACHRYPVAIKSLPDLLSLGVGAHRLDVLGCKRQPDRKCGAR